MPIRVLVVEDDDSVRAALRLGLEDEGYEVLEAPGAERALELFASNEVDMMIVDLMLGEVSGLDFIRAVRRSSDRPVLVLSARDDTHDVVAGLEAGADDYVVKPFQLKELAARLRALQRRSAGLGRLVPSTDIVLDGTDREARLVLSAAAGRLTRGEEEIHLTLTEFRILQSLAEASGLVMSRGQLVDVVWEHGFFGDDRLVDVHIRRLRTKIERDPSSPQLLLTVRGFGYRLDPR